MIIAATLPPRGFAFSARAFHFIRAHLSEARIFFAQSGFIFVSGFRLEETAGRTATDASEVSTGESNNPARQDITEMTGDQYPFPIFSRFFPSLHLGKRCDGLSFVKRL
jgi:hypothetical protein